MNCSFGLDQPSLLQCLQSYIRYTVCEFNGVTNYRNEFIILHFTLGPKDKHK